MLDIDQCFDRFAENRQPYGECFWCDQLADHLRGRLLLCDTHAIIIDRINATAA